APPAAAEDVGLLPTLALEAPKLPSLSAESLGFDDDEKTLALKPGALSPAQLAALTAPPVEAPKASAPLADLVDEDSGQEESSDPFALPRSRAAVRISTLPPPAVEARAAAPATASAAPAPARPASAPPAAQPVAAAAP